MRNIFRRKSVDQIHSAEQLNDYIHVTSPSVWLVLLAIVLLLIGILAWSILGTVEAVSPDGKTQTLHLITLITN